MNTNPYSGSFQDHSSAATLPQDGKRGYWWLPSEPTNAPSIAQLARSRAQELDAVSEHKSSIFDEGYSPDSEKEKQHDESTIPSSNDSGVFHPPQHNQPKSLPPQPSMSKTREFAFIFITCAAQFLSLAALNQTVAPVIVLAKYFQIEDYGTLSWFSASFSMSVGTFILPAGEFPQPWFEKSRHEFNGYFTSYSFRGPSIHWSNIDYNRSTWRHVWA